MKKILVVVDMQNDFIDGPLGTPEARAIVDNVCAKIREGEWNWIIRTMDTHDDRYLDTQEGKKLPVKHCHMDSAGWCSNEDVRHAIQESRIRSDWVNKDSFGSTGLIDILRYVYPYSVNDEQNEFEITLIGVCTDICVISNALLLKAHYPEMKIVVDAACCAGSSPEKHRMALEVMKSCQIDVLNEPESESKQMDVENMPEDLPDNYIVRNFVE